MSVQELSAQRHEKANLLQLPLDKITTILTAIAAVSGAAYLHGYWYSFLGLAWFEYVSPINFIIAAIPVLSLSIITLLASALGGKFLGWIFIEISGASWARNKFDPEDTEACMPIIVILAFLLSFCGFYVWFKVGTPLLLISFYIMLSGIFSRLFLREIPEHLTRIFFIALVTLSPSSAYFYGKTSAALTEMKPSLIISSPDTVNTSYTKAFIGNLGDYRFFLKKIDGSSWIEVATNREMERYTVKKVD